MGAELAAGDAEGVDAGEAEAEEGVSTHSTSTPDILKKPIVVFDDFKNKQKGPWSSSTYFKVTPDT